VTVDDSDFLATRFEEHRGHLRAVAYRMLGSLPEADDAVQEAWFRLMRTDTDEVDNLGGWLTTVVGRVCLDMLRSRKSRREEPLEAHDTHVAATADPEQEVMHADAVGLALLVVLDTLGPAERLAFVLHDLFAMPFEEIAPIVRRSPAATRQLASRARRRVQGASPDSADSSEADDAARRRRVVDAFLAASRAGEFDALLTLLDPEVRYDADAVAVKMGSASEVVGADKVAQVFSGRAQAAELRLVNGTPALVWSMDGEVRTVFEFAVENGRVVAISLVADPGHLAELAITD
jgi:RNA polymerase sigma factor (sigma-70 family)